jgi:hypothetical protein
VDAFKSCGFHEHVERMSDFKHLTKQLIRQVRSDKFLSSLNESHREINNQLTKKNDRSHAQKKMMLIDH